MYVQSVPPSHADCSCYILRPCWGMIRDPKVDVMPTDKAADAKPVNHKMREETR